MIRLQVLSNPRLAQAYVDYMATRGVTVRVQSISQNRVELWLQDEQNLAEAAKALEQFLDAPDDPRYAAASWQRGITDLPLRYQHFSYWHVIREGGGVVTHCVMALCVGIYLLIILFGQDVVMSELAFPADRTQYLQFWRWLTPALVHFSVQHILFNLVMWWYLGGMVERHLGSSKLLHITLLGAVLSSCTQSLFSGVFFGGLSGVVYTLIGYVWLSGEKVPARGLYLPRAMIAVIAIWFFIDYFDFLGPVANAAHFSGLMLGLLLAFLDTWVRKPS